MQRCNRCNAEIDDNAHFCSACGAKAPAGEQHRGASPYSGSISHHMVTTTFDVGGQEVVSNLGLVRGIVVRSRSVVGTLGATLQTLVGGDITLFTNLCEDTRRDAFERMLQHAVELGANAVIGVRYDATEIMQGVTEVLAYGTAVVVKPRANS
jgi:uncharacterized protein YbjQ (UPF0145 family)